MSKICLTEKQELYLKVIKAYHKKNGTFPNESQLVAAVREAGGKAGSGAMAMYGTLLLKGAFTSGLALSDSAASLHSGGDIEPLSVHTMTFAPKRLNRGRKPGVPNKPKAIDANVIAAALLDLLKSNNNYNDIIAALNQ